MTHFPGSYQCECLEGYNRTDSLLFTDPCTDIDECLKGTHTCDKNAACINLSPGFSCTCNEPFWRGNGQNCYYFDPCWNEPCGDYATCTINITDEGHYSCPCQAPRIGSGKGNEKCHCETGFWDKYTLNCVDIDECSIKPNETDKELIAARNQCDKNSDCKNTIGSYACSCIDGFTGNGRVCKDQDECLLGLHRCKANTKCINKDESYDCQCIDGYIDNGYKQAQLKCHDLNECHTNNHNCDPKTTICHNLIGSFRCRCKDGYTQSDKDKTKCVDVNECLGNPCKEDGKECRNKKGGYDCVCRKGFKKDGDKCTDVDECETTNPCEKSERCVNRDGGYDCECATGFYLSLDKCHDINECTSEMHCLEMGQVCNNTIGSFKCDCKPGYNMTEDDGLEDDLFGEDELLGFCEDIDECETNSHMCLTESEECQNTEGSYTCDCRIGYRRLGEDCVDINECYVDPCTNPNHQCENNVGSYDCVCKAGWYSAPNTTICYDVDECLYENADCMNGEKCENTIGSYECVCAEGYLLVGGECVDVNECFSTVCPPNSECKNTDGSYYCDCGGGRKAEKVTGLKSFSLFVRLF